MSQSVHSEDKLHFRGLAIKRLSLSDSLEKVLQQSQSSPVKVFWANAHSVNVSEHNPELKQALQKADFLLNDGAGIELAGWILGQPVVENLNGTDWLPAFFNRAQEQGFSLYLLGAKEWVIKAAVEVFKARWPKLAIHGYHHGYFQDPAEVLDQIDNTRPSVLVVGMGVPLQELFITEHWERLKRAGVKIALAGGAIFDFISEEVPRAPSWMRKLRLEWAFRLCLEPCRLAGRYLFGNLQFLRLLLTEIFSKGGV